MRIHFIVPCLLLPLGCLFLACSKAPPLEKLHVAEKPWPIETWLAEGEQIYAETCMMCHLDGKGSEMVPPHIGAPALAKEDPSELITIILKGQKGEIIRGGKKFNGIMPPMSNLSDQEVAAVSTYVRHTYGTFKTPVQPEQVRKLR